MLCARRTASERQYRCNSEYRRSERVLALIWRCSALRLTSCIWSKTTESFFAASVLRHASKLDRELELMRA